MLASDHFGSCLKAAGFCHPGWLPYACDQIVVVGVGTEHVSCSPDLQLRFVADPVAAVPGALP